jgi:uncharacterized protein YbjT (DUF2867 family)
MAILVIGATGLLGQEIVIQALESGYNVRCLVRNINKSSNLRRFGAKLLYGDLSLPETVPLLLRGVQVIVDASTLRLNATYHLEKVEWYGKLVLLKSAKLAKVKRFIFFSIANLQYHPDVYFMKIKFQFEKVLIGSKVPYTIFRVSGFLQSLIGEYSRRILDENSVWVMKKEESTNYSYIDVYAVAKLCLQSFYLLDAKNKAYILTDKEISLGTEIENLCKTVIGPLAEIIRLPSFLLKLTNKASVLLESTWNITDRFSLFEAISDFPFELNCNFYLNKKFRVKCDSFYSYPSYIRDYLDLIIFDLQKLHKT